MSTNPEDIVGTSAIEKIASEGHEQLIVVAEDFLKSLHGLGRRGSSRDFTTEWVDSVRLTVGDLRDVIESGQPSYAAAARLVNLLRNPRRNAPSISREEMEELGYEDTEDQRAWVWGEDRAASFSLFGAAAIIAILATVAFQVVHFALEEPELKLLILVDGLAGFTLGLAGSLLGWGLFREYVPYSRIGNSRAGRPDHIFRYWRGQRFLKRFFAAYAGGSFLLGTGVTIATVVNTGAFKESNADQEMLRLSLLACLGLGVIFLGVGSWPVVRRVVIEVERGRRGTAEKRMLIPRISIAIIPAIVGGGFLLFSWLFSR